MCLYWYLTQCRCGGLIEESARPVTGDVQRRFQDYRNAIFLHRQYLGLTIATMQAVVTARSLRQGILLMLAQVAL